MRVPVPASSQYTIQLPNQLPVNENKQRIYLPVLLEGMYMVEQVTGMLWTPTSYVRDSPSHSKHISLDIVPDMTPRMAAKFATFQEIPSDPVLPLRLDFINLLLPLTKIKRSSIPWNTNRFSLMIFIESDHLHLQVGSPRNKRPISLVKWHQPKPGYSDTKKRGGVGMFRGEHPISCCR